MESKLKKKFQSYKILEPVDSHTIDRLVFAIQNYYSSSKNFKTYINELTLSK